MQPSPDFLTDHRLYNQKYRIQDSRGCAMAGATLLRLAASPVLVTAPHSVVQFRAGREKCAEYWTGAIAESLGMILNANVVTALSPRTETENAASADDYLRVVHLMLNIQHIGLVFDIHGIGPHRAHDIYIGSAGFPEGELLDSLFRDLASRFNVHSHPALSGKAGLAGLVNYDRTAEAYVLQLELGARLRRDMAEAADLHVLAGCLGRFAEAFLSKAPPKRT
jgi:hypothetical protein